VCKLPSADLLFRKSEPTVGLRRATGFIGSTSVMAGLNLNLLDQLTFYGSYHSNKWNQASLLLLLHLSGFFMCVSSLVDAPSRQFTGYYSV
jgi:hypothetical protein